MDRLRQPPQGSGDERRPALRGAARARPARGEGRRLTARRLLAVAAAGGLLAAPAAAEAGLRSDLRRALRPAGAASGLVVHDLSRGRRVISVRGNTVRPLASNTKLFTVAAALRALGPDATLPTSVLARIDPDGTVPGDLHVRGFGDPAFEREAVERLADQVAARVRVVRGSVVGDGTLFDDWRGRTGPAFESELEGVLGGLVFDRGRAVDGGPLQADPARAAASRLDDALEARGVVIHGTPRSGPAPLVGEPLGNVSSPPVRTLAASIGKRSDDFVAEMIAKYLAAVRREAPGTTAKGAAVIEEIARGLGAQVSLVDGSGLSRSDRSAPREVVDLLRAMEGDRAFAASLSIAGVDGTASDRMRRSAARRRCRVKTGTLPDSRVSALAGYCRSRSGRRYAFSVIVTRRAERVAERVEDRIAALLARR